MKKFKLNGQWSNWLGKFLGRTCRPTNMCSLLWSVGWRVAVALFLIVFGFVFIGVWMYANYEIVLAIFTDQSTDGGAIAFALIFDIFFVIICSLYVSEHGWPKWFQPVIGKVTSYCPKVEWDESDD